MAVVVMRGSDTIGAGDDSARGGYRGTADGLRLNPPLLVGHG